MGLISDRKNKANRRAERNDALHGSSKSLAVYPQQTLPHPPPPLHHHPHPLPPLHHGLGPPPGHAHAPPPHKRGIFGPQVLPTDANGLPIKNNAPKYPAGYYTTPVGMGSSGAGWVQQYNVHQYGGGGGSGGGHHHKAQPKYQPNVNPRYQTWVAPRKQPSLGQLVRRTPRIRQSGGQDPIQKVINHRLEMLACTLVMATQERAFSELIACKAVRSNSVCTYPRPR